jgi:hypothetical protein
MAEGYPRGLVVESTGVERACCRTMRAKVLVVLVGLSLVGSACTDGGGSDAPVQDPHARLDALGERWMTTVATITHRTIQRDPGEATSPHQCLRQFVGDTVDRQTGVMLCSGTGEIRLAWERSDRWRMDEDSADGSSTSLFGPDEYVRCRFDGAASVRVARRGPGPDPH